MNCPESPAVLCVNSLSKTFHLHEQNAGINAFQDVSFAVLPGAVTALVGPSGAGKSSVLKCIYRTYRPTSGSVRFHISSGKWIDLVTANDEDILRVRKWDIGFVTQYLHCIPRQSALVVASRPLVDRGTARDAAAEAATLLFQRLRLPEKLWRIPPATMSGGERQKVNLARGLLAGTRLLLVDEAVASLDAVSTDLAIELILERCAAGVGVITIFHNPDHLRRVSGAQILLQGPGAPL